MFPVPFIYPLLPPRNYIVPALPPRTRRDPSPSAAGPSTPTRRPGVRWTDTFRWPHGGGGGKGKGKGKAKALPARERIDSADVWLELADESPSSVQRRRQEQHQHHDRDAAFLDLCHRRSLSASAVDAMKRPNVRRQFHTWLRRPLRTLRRRGEHRRRGSSPYAVDPFGDAFAVEADEDEDEEEEKGGQEGERWRGGQEEGEEVSRARSEPQAASSSSSSGHAPRGLQTTPRYVPLLPPASPGPVWERACWRDGGDDDDGAGPSARVGTGAQGWGAVARRPVAFGAIPSDDADSESGGDRGGYRREQKRREAKARLHVSARRTNERAVAAVSRDQRPGGKRLGFTSIPSSSSGWTTSSSSDPGSCGAEEHASQVKKLLRRGRWAAKVGVAGGARRVGKAAVGVVKGVGKAVAYPPWRIRWEYERRQRPVDEWGFMEPPDDWMPALRGWATG